MDEYKPPKRPLITLWVVAMVLLLVMNLVMIPFAEKQRIQEVDYGTFMEETDKGNIDQVQILTNKIEYTLKSDAKSNTQVIYETGLMNDDGLVERLYKSGAKFSCPSCSLSFSAESCRSVCSRTWAGITPCSLAETASAWAAWARAMPVSTSNPAMASSFPMSPARRRPRTISRRSSPI